MVKWYDGGTHLVNGTHLIPEEDAARVTAMTGKEVHQKEAKKGGLSIVLKKRRFFRR